MIAGMLLDTAKVIGVLAVLGAVLAAHPRTRRVAVAMVRYGKAHMSPWMLVVTGACLAVPGPLDEIVVVPLLVAFTLRTRRNRVIFARYMRIAWARLWTAAGTRGSARWARALRWPLPY